MKSKRRRRPLPQLNTAALPDLIFTVLFFFMLVTHMRQGDTSLSYQLPEGRELQKPKSRQNITYLYIGRAHAHAYNNKKVDDYSIQVGSSIVAPDDIPAAIEKERLRLPEDERGRMVVAIRADKDVSMGIVDDVKQKLKEVGALSIAYVATEAGGKGNRRKDGE